MFEFKFGTPKPVKFIEPVLEGVEEEVEARTNGIMKIHDYNQSKYGSEEDLKSFIKSNICVIVSSSLNECWPEGQPKVRGMAVSKKLGPIIDELLEGLEITSETQIVNFVLLPESEKRIKELQKMYIYSQNNSGWDHVNFDHVNNIVKNTPINNGLFPNPSNYGMLDGPGMMYKPKVEPVYYKDRWVCTVCGVNDNHGNFCSNCGSKRPEDKVELAPGEWICVCGAKSSGKFCYNCGRAKE